ncbi:MAG: RNA polymerase subunit sigma-24, partial [Clostridia bacterium]|nr:RNA polymerase subunit sigma-24 [Clostridia bacterium]
MDKATESYRRYLAGDENAPREIMDELFYGLVFFVDRFVHDVHSAEDIALDVISDLFVHRHRFDFRTSLKT